MPCIMLGHPLSERRSDLTARVTFLFSLFQLAFFCLHDHDSQHALHAHFSLHSSMHAFNLNKGRTGILVKNKAHKTTGR